MDTQWKRYSADVRRFSARTSFAAKRKIVKIGVCYFYGTDLLIIYEFSVIGRLNTVLVSSSNPWPLRYLVTPARVAKAVKVVYTPIKL